jgi:hypothetical protein
MAVYEIRYKPWEGTLVPTRLRWLSIPKYSMMAISSKGLGWSLFGAGTLQLLGYTVFLIVINNPVLMALIKAPVGSAISPDRVIRGFMFVQTFFCLGPLVMAAPKLVAPELQHNALSILYARPITKMGYYAGKFITLAAILSFLTWFQGLLLFFVMYVSYPETHEFHTAFATVAWPLLKGIMIHGLAITMVFSSVGVCASSLTKNSNFAGGLLLMMLFGSSFIGAFLGEQLAHPLYAMGIWSSLQQIGENVFAGNDPNLSLFAALSGAIFWTVAPTLVALWRLRPVDVHKD